MSRCQRPGRLRGVAREDRRAFQDRGACERVWAAIRDAQVVAPCIPGCKSVETIDATHYRAVVAVALGPIKAVFNLIIEIASEVPGKELTTVARGEEGGKASSLNARSLLRLEPSDGSTEVIYESEVVLTGRLGNYGLGLMKKRAQALGQEFARNLQRLLTGSQSDGTGVLH